MYVISINYHIEITRFCFMFILPQELDDMKSIWNTDYIREVRNSECPPGRPSVEQSGGRSFIFPVNEMDIKACHPFCYLPDVNGYTNETQELVRLIMCGEELEFSANATQGINAVELSRDSTRKNYLSEQVVIRQIRTTCRNKSRFDNYEPKCVQSWCNNFKKCSFLRMSYMDHRR